MNSTYTHANTHTHTHTHTESIINCILLGCAQIFQKSRSDLKILGARRVTCSRLHTEGPQISGDTMQNLVAQTTWRPAFVHPCHVVYTKRPTKLLRNFRWLFIGLSAKCMNTSSNCMYYIIYVPIPVAVRSKASVCGPWLTGIVDSNPVGAWMYVSCECWMLAFRGL